MEYLSQRLSAALSVFKRCRLSPDRNDTFKVSQVVIGAIGLIKPIYISRSTAPLLSLLQALQHVDKRKTASN